jgi:hypothetical protein
MSLLDDLVTWAVVLVGAELQGTLGCYPVPCSSFIYPLSFTPPTLTFLPLYYVIPSPVHHHEG